METKMEWSLLGGNKRRATFILIVGALTSIGLRVRTEINPNFRSWPFETPFHIPFFPWIIIFGLAILFAYRKSGWIVSVGIVSFGVLARSPGAAARSPDPVIAQVVGEFLSSLIWGLIWGTVCYILGVSFRYVALNTSR